MQKLFCVATTNDTSESQTTKINECIIDNLVTKIKNYQLQNMNLPNDKTKFNAT